MKNIFYLEKISRTGNLDSKLVVCQHELDLRARLMEIQSVNPRVKQDQIAKNLDAQVVR